MQWYGVGECEEYTLVQHRNYHLHGWHGVGEMVRWLLVVSGGPEVCRSPHEYPWLQRYIRRDITCLVCSTVQAHTVVRTVRICRMLARNVQSEIHGYRVLPLGVVLNQWIWVDSSGPHVDHEYLHT